MSNRAAVLHGVRDLRIELRPMPEPGPHEVLVEVRAVGVCGSDVHYYEHGRIGDYVVREPLVLGHEASGVVVGQGAQARRLPLGTRVALEPGVPCGRCRECRSGRYNLCPAVRFFATPPVDGAFARYVVLHEDFAHPVPDSLSDEAAALIEPFSVGLWAARRAGVRPGDDVLITGAGPIGLLAAAAVTLAGAASVTVVDINPHRLSSARAFGATATHDSSTEPFAGSVAVLIECTGHPGATRSGISALRPAGRAVLVGMGADEITIPLAALQGREVQVTGTFRYANTYPGAIAAAAAGRVDLDALVTHRFQLDDTEQALLATRNDPSALKPVVSVASGQ